MKFIKLHSAEEDESIIRINVSHIILYVPIKDKNITGIQTDGKNQVVYVKETVEEIDALIEST